MRKVLLNGDVINDNNSIYICFEGSMFEMFAFPVKTEIVECIITAIEEMEAFGYKISLILIPIFQQLEFQMQQDKTYPQFKMCSLDDVVHQLTASNVNLMVMIPDQLKDKCKPTN